jgi:hypothetical protein
MENYKLKFKNFEKVQIFILDEKKKISQKFKKIPSEREGPDSSGSFRY